jgi:hypothetical protein
LLDELGDDGRLGHVDGVVGGGASAGASAISVLSDSPSSGAYAAM